MALFFTFYVFGSDCFTTLAAILVSDLLSVVLFKNAVVVAFLKGWWWCLSRSVPKNNNNNNNKRVCYYSTPLVVCVTHVCSGDKVMFRMPVVPLLPEYN